MASSLALNSSVLLKRLTNPIRAITSAPSAAIARCFSTHKGLTQTLRAPARLVHPKSGEVLRTHAQRVRAKFLEQNKGKMNRISSRGNHAQMESTKFYKQHKGRMNGISSRGNHVCFGKYALQALEPAWITSRQIEAGRRAMKLKEQKEGRGRKVWVRIFPNKPVTRRPAETRMGRGKGSPQYCVAVVKPGRILYELSGVTEGIARKSISIAASKMPIRTQFIILK